MSKYTKQYRHRVYKKTLKNFGEPYGLCLLIRNNNPDKEHIWFWQTPHFFPEFHSQYGKLVDALYRAKTDRGRNNARLRCLRKCIEQTAPTTDEQ